MVFIRLMLAKFAFDGSSTRISRASARWTITPTTAEIRIRLFLEGISLLQTAKCRSAAPPWCLERCSSCALAEQCGTHRGVLHVDLARFLDAQMDAAVDRRPRHHGLEPALEMREIVEVLTEALVDSHPADAGHVGDGVAARQKFAVGQPGVHHAKNAVDLVGEALDGVVLLLGRRIVAEVARLPGLGAEVCHLPIEPLLDLDARALVARIEFAGLAAKILQDRP